jgi:hypothetical protein
MALSETHRIQNVAPAAQFPGDRRFLVSIERHGASIMN